jgi:hypothetical protein
MSDPTPEQPLGAPREPTITESRKSVDFFGPPSVQSRPSRALVAVNIRQARFVAAIGKFRLTHGRWPSLGETTKEVRLSRARTQTVVRRLCRLGVLGRAPGAVSIEREPDGVFLTLGEVRA